MTRIVADVGFGYTIQDSSIVWTDISRFVDETTGLRIDNRGSADEMSQTQPTTCALRLNDEDGRFAPGRPGPYAPNVKKNAPIRIAVATLTPQSGSAPYPLAQLGDDFDDDTVDTTKWSGNFNGAIEGKGYARVPAAAGVTAGYASARQYTLTGSQSSVRLVTVPSGAGAATAQCAFMVNSVTSGTRLGFLINAVSGLLSCRSEVAFSDGGAVNLTYSASAHGWLRIREAAGTVYWETSPDGATWTVRRSLATPAWVGTDQVLLAMTAFRDAGTTDFAEFDLVGATIHPRFFGMVNQWPVTWAGRYSTVSITCTDVFKLLSRAPALRPMLIQEVLLDGPLAYYPMGEGSESTSAGDESGVVGPSSLTVQQKGSGGSLTFGTSGGPADTLSSPTFTPDDGANGQYLRADLGDAFRSATVTDFKLFEAWFNTVTRGRNIFTVFNSDEGRYIIFYLAGATGYLTVEIKAPTTSATTVTVGSVDLADGKVHHVVYQELTKEIVVDGVSLGTFPAIFTVATLDTLHVGASQNGFNLWQGSVSHVALYANTSLTAADLATHYTTGLNNHTGETADLRAARLASYVGMTVLAQGSGFSPIVRQAGLGSSGLDHMREVERTEAGRLLSSRSSAAIVLQSRSLRNNPVAAFTVAYADLETNEVELADDDQKMVNTLLLSRPTGSQTRIANQAARAAYGPYEQTLELFTTTDDAMIDRGNWIISRYSDPPPELRTVPLEASTLGLTTYRAILDSDISSAFTITSLPAEAPASSLTCTIEGYSETITSNQHMFNLFASRTDLDTRWVLNDTTYSVLGTTTRLGF